MQYISGKVRIIFKLIIFGNQNSLWEKDGHISMHFAQLTIMLQQVSLSIKLMSRWVALMQFFHAWLLGINIPL